MNASLGGAETQTPQFIGVEMPVGLEGIVPATSPLGGGNFLR